jgi:energy-coupling factor transport system ATP-binding protein
MMETLLSLHVRSLRARDRVLMRDVRVNVARGEIVGVAGHVGAGKTTLGLAAAGLLHHGGGLVLEGEIRHPARAGTAPPAGYVFANPWTQLTGWGSTVREEIAVGPENLGLAPALIATRVDAALEQCGVGHLASRAPLELSGGELQRVALASALALGAPLLVLDEPSSQLDPESAAELGQRLQSLAAAGAGVLLIEQNLQLLAETCDRLIVLADGGVLDSGSAAELLSRWPPLDPRLGALPEVRAQHEPPLPAAALRDGGPALSVDGLRAGYDRHDVLDGVSLSIPEGAVAAWRGPNGAGKSTLARTIMGLVPAREGRIVVRGVVLDALPVEVRARHVGFGFQDPGAQLFSARVLDEVSFGPRALGRSASAAREAAREALDLVGLGDQASDHPGDLPPQARRLVALAAVMASRPPLLILDEPTAGQDAAGRQTLARVLEEQRRRGAAAVITHDYEFARRHCDQFHQFERQPAPHAQLPAAHPAEG